MAEKTTKVFWSGEKTIRNGSWEIEEEYQSRFTTAQKNLEEDGIPCTGTFGAVLLVDFVEASKGNLPELVDYAPLQHTSKLKAAPAPHLTCTQAAQKVIEHTLTYARRVSSGSVDDTSINPRALQYRTLLADLENVQEALKFHDRAMAGDTETAAVLEEGTRQKSPTVQVRWNTGAAIQKKQAIQNSLNHGILKEIVDEF